MCRHLAYLGPPMTLQSLLLDPPHSLLRQSWAPRMQRHGTVNALGVNVLRTFPGTYQILRGTGQQSTINLSLLPAGFFKPTGGRGAEPAAL